MELRSGWWTRPMVHSNVCLLVCVWGAGCILTQELPSMHVAAALPMRTISPLSFGISCTEHTGQCTHICVLLLPSMTLKCILLQPYARRASCTCILNSDDRFGQLHMLFRQLSLACASSRPFSDVPPLKRLTHNSSRS